MHSDEGAWSETLLVYRDPASDALKKGLPPHYVVVGLGLGYIEIMLTALALSQNKINELVICSFESDTFLRSSFISWVCDQGKEPLLTAYEYILSRAAEEFGLAQSKLKESLIKLFSEKRFIIEGELAEETKTTKKFAGILFDAYSKISSAELWSEEFLSSFLEKFSESTAFFTTYAATGNLKRTLQKNGFEVSFLPGFGRKRERTVALKEAEEKPI